MGEHQEGNIKIKISIINQHTTSQRLRGIGKYIFFVVIIMIPYSKYRRGSFSLSILIRLFLVTYSTDVSCDPVNPLFISLYLYTWKPSRI